MQSLKLDLNLRKFHAKGERKLHVVRAKKFSPRVERRIAETLAEKKGLLARLMLSLSLEFLPSLIAALLT